MLSVANINKNFRGISTQGTVFVACEDMFEYWQLVWDKSIYLPYWSWHKRTWDTS